MTDLPERFSRTALLIGEEGVRRLARARVAVFGVGGVGSYTVEALARAGVGNLRLIDRDVVTVSNINRQLHALDDTVGQSKTALMARRVAGVNPEARVEAVDAFCLQDNVAELLPGDYDYLVDAVDTVSAKLAIAAEGYRRGIPVIAAMGAGNKLDPARFEIADLYKTSVCPLCRVMRRELRKMGIPRLKVVYSREEPVAPRGIAPPDPESGKIPPGSISFVPAAAGLILAGAVVRDLLAIAENS